MPLEGISEAKRSLYTPPDFPRNRLNSISLFLSLCRIPRSFSLQHGDIYKKKKHFLPFPFHVESQSRHPQALPASQADTLKASTQTDLA